MDVIRARRRDSAVLFRYIQGRGPAGAVTKKEEAMSDRPLQREIRLDDTILRKLEVLRRKVENAEKQGLLLCMTDCEITDVKKARTRSRSS